jgi:hypothetical protein
MMEDAYRLFARHHAISKIVGREIRRLPDEEIEVPDDLGFEVSLRLQNFPPTSWDIVVQEICQERIGSREQGQAGGATSP